MQPKCSLTFSQEPASGPVLHQSNPAHIKSYFFKIHFNSILSYKHGFLMCLLKLMLPNIILYDIFISPMRATCSIYFTVIDFLPLTTWGESINYNGTHYTLFYILFLTFRLRPVFEWETKFQFRINKFWYYLMLE